MNKVSSISRVVLTIIGVLTVLSLAFQAPAAFVPGAVNLVGTWDRLNPNQGGASPEHEVLRCGGSAAVFCVYDKQPERLLGFQNPPDSTIGYFRGRDVTANWSCPAWFPANVCANTVFVASVVATYYQSGGTQLVANQDLAVSNVGGQSRLYVYWVDYGFACLWFRSFGEALAANPFPLPFNGQDWPAGDCLVP